MWCRQRGLGRKLLMKCHEIVMGPWSDEIRKMTPAERLDIDVARIFLKVDADNLAAVNLYRREGYKEVVRVSEELMVPKSATAVQEWPVLNVYMQLDMHPFNPLKSFARF
jgi:RimJ/RimL family protein N-acetyltransferase